MKKKILSIILACCMSLTMMTPLVYAEETTEVIVEEQEDESTEEIVQDEQQISEEATNVQEETNEEVEESQEDEEVTDQDEKLESEKVENFDAEQDAETDTDDLVSVLSAGDGQYIWPVDTTYSITAGMYYSSGSYHGATDFGCPVGTPVVSTASGTVIDVVDRGCQGSHQSNGKPKCPLGSSCRAVTETGKSHGSYGNYVVISHGNNVYSWYCHMSTGRFTVSKGQHVEQGTLIGYSGAAGNASGPHLHFEMRVGGNSYKTNNVDPQNYLTKTYFVKENDQCNCSDSYAGNYTCTTSSQNLTIRSGHGSSYSKVGSIPSGATVYVSKASGTGAGNWAHVEYNGISGLASMEYLQKQDTGHDPFGVLDSATGGVHSVTIRGWALDEDDYGTTLGIHAYIGDTCIGTTVADLYRPDVNEVYGCGDYHGYIATFDVDTNITGEQTVRVYAINTGGGSVNSMIGSATVNIEKDTEAPIISDCKVSDITSTGYTVTCTVTDDNGVDRVQFPTWTKKDGQDDIIQDWDRNEAASGTKDGDTYTYHVDVADHNNESGLYNTHIYAYDKYGNSVGKAIDGIEVPEMPEIAKDMKDDFYATVQNTSNNTFLTKVHDGKSWDTYFEKESGERTQIWHFIKNTDDSGTYTIYCEGNEALVLDVADGVDTEQNNIRVWTTNGSEAQKWDILEKDGEYYLKPLCSNLRVLGCSKTNEEYFNAQMASYNTRDCGIKITEVSCTKTELNDESLINEGNYKGHHYEVFDQGMTWSDAKRVCEELGGHLVTITSEEEQNFVTSLIEEGKMNQYWLGLHRYSQEYAWITGESVEYSNWDKGEPNGIENNKEYCAEILNKANPAVSGSQRFKWNDVNNSNTVSGETDFFNTDLVGFICEYDSVKSYTLTYDANGGTNAPEKKTDEQDAILKVSEDTPIRRGYRFLGWSTDKDAEKAEYQANDEIKLTKDITLYAVWEKMDATGTCGEKVFWELDQQGVLTIYGEGAMKNYTYKSEMPWYKYLSKIQKVVIEKGVTTIGDYAFYGMTDTTEITIPEGVTTIGEYAFKNSTKIAEVKLPSTLKKLGQSAFYGCTSLNKIAIPEGLYTIWGYTFKNCTSLAEVTLPSTLIKIDEAAFYGCSSLKKIEIPEDVSIIGIYCFKNCSNLSEISLPESMTKIREAAFYGTAITEITIPDSVTAIGSYAFKNCAKLKKVNLSKELKTIEESAFYACESMTKLILPSNVTTIGDYAFRRCVGLQVVEFSDSLKKIGESAFYGCSDLSELVLPEGMTEIGAYTFKSCTNVTSVSLPSTLNVIGESGFYGCDRIESIEIPAAVNTIGDYAFSRCTELNTVTFKGDAPSIADYTFAKVKATVYYPGDNETWTQDKMKNYGGTLTWKKN